MYCSGCGAILQEGAKYCGGCGGEIVLLADPVPEQEAEVLSQESRLIGFSDKINDPAFAKYQKASKSWSYLFAVILAVIAVIGFPIYGQVSGELEMPTSLYYGMGIGGMFIIIAFMQSLKRRFDTTWDGVVIDKQSHKRVRHDQRDDSQHHYVEYVFKVKRDSGKVYKHKTTNQPGLYGYYNIGDKVRHHKGFYYYEKYDKSQDKQFLCIACLSMNEPERDTCVRCKWPLLK